MVTAFRNQDGSWAVVAINYADETADFKLSLPDGKRHRWQAYRTSEEETLKPVGSPTVLPPRSITTFVDKPLK